MLPEAIGERRGRILQVSAQPVLAITINASATLATGTPVFGTASATRGHASMVHAGTMMAEGDSSKLSVFINNAKSMPVTTISKTKTSVTTKVLVGIAGVSVAAFAAAMVAANKPIELAVPTGITVTNPILNQTVDAREKVTVRWESDKKSIARVGISLMKDGETFGNIVVDTPNTGNYVWQPIELLASLPDFPLGQQFVIQVHAVDNPTGLVGKSGSFMFE